MATPAFNTAFAGAPRRVTPMRQDDLPEGIAYAWHVFPWIATEPNYVAGLNGAALALIPVRDFDLVPEGTTLRDIHGFAFVKGTDRLDQYNDNIRDGYYPFGYYLFTKPHANEFPTKTCLRCGSKEIFREYDTSFNADFVTCGNCQMYWQEPFAPQV